MAWRVAACLLTLLDQVNEAWPDRSRISDGTIGDDDHASRTSDHNPWVPPPNGGVVTALDLTNDPAHGADMNLLAESLRKSQDPRIKYVIWNHRMFSSYPTSSSPAWAWRPYSGSNPHDHHMHVSVQPTGYDNEKKWLLPTGKDWMDMASEAEVRKIVKEEIEAAVAKLAVGKTQAKKGYDSDKVNIKAAIK